MAGCADANCTIATCCKNDLVQHFGGGYENYTACVFGGAGAPRGYEVMGLWVVFYIVVKLIDR